MTKKSKKVTTLVPATKALGEPKKEKLPPAPKTLRTLPRTPSVEELLTATGYDIIDAALAHYPNVISDDENYAFIPSPSETPNPIMLVAHVDTVRRADPTSVINRRGVICAADDDALGADDRAGVYGILEARRRCEERGIDLPHILLTNHEECGGVGVSMFVKDGVLEDHLQDIRMLVELDRKGSEEAVTYGGDLPEGASKYLRTFGWRLGNGSYSDIATLIDEYHIPAVNLSCGYYQQHTDHEYLVLAHLESCIDRLMLMLEDPFTEHERQEGYIPLSRGGGYGYGYEYGYGGDWDSDWHHWSKDSKKSTNGSSQPGSFDFQMMEEVDECIEEIAGPNAGHGCPICGYAWQDCPDECGNMAEELAEKLSIDALGWLVESPHANAYLAVADPIFDALEEAYYARLRDIQDAKRSV